MRREFSRPCRTLAINYTVNLALLVSMAISGNVLAQSSAFKVDPESIVLVEGTSTLRDWSAQVSEFDGSLVFNKDILKKPIKSGEAVEEVKLSFNVKSMDGGRGESMNGKIYEALKEKEHPQIIFVSTAPAKIISVNDKVSFIIKSQGDLSLAGVSKPVEVELEGTRLENGQFKFVGKKELKLSDFNIERPSAMFGQIVTGDEITINFDLLVKNQ